MLVVREEIRHLFRLDLGPVASVGSMVAVREVLLPRPLEGAEAVEPRTCDKAAMDSITGSSLLVAAAEATATEIVAAPVRIQME